MKEERRHINMDNKAWSKIHQVCMEIWNLKSSGNMYFEFEVTFGVLTKVHFGKTIYCFKSLELRNPTLQILHKLNLKRGSYAHFNQTGQRGKLSFKLTTWVRNGFWPFKTQRNARKILENAKFKSYYLFQVRGT